MTININYDLDPQETELITEAMRGDGFNPDTSLIPFYAKRLLKMHARQVIINQLQHINTDNTSNAELRKKIDTWHRLMI